MIIVIDNYDSFTHNLIHYLDNLNQTVRVFQHDQITVDELETFNPQAILLSPGPKSPSEAGISIDCIHRFYQSVPIIGICLGLQCLVQAFGGHIVPAPQILHGKTSLIHHDQTGIFRNLPKQFSVTRYHSLVADATTLPSCFKIQARSLDDDAIMAICHRTLPIYGIQFHPEAILTEYGYELLEQFIHDTHETTV